MHTHAYAHFVDFAIITHDVLGPPRKKEENNADVTIDKALNCEAYTRIQCTGKAGLIYTTHGSVASPR